MADEETSQPAAELPRGVRKVTRGWEIDLDYPIEHGGEDVTTLKMRRSNIGDSEAMARHIDEDDEASNIAAGILLASRLLGLTEDETRTIDQDDWPRIQEVIAAHMEKLAAGRQT